MTILEILKDRICINNEAFIEPLFQRKILFLFPVVRRVSAKAKISCVKLFVYRFVFGLTSEHGEIPVVEYIGKWKFLQ